MSNREFTATRTMLANAFATAGAELLAYMGSSSALAAIPETDPPKYVAAGPLDEIAKLLPASDKPAAATVLTDERIKQVARDAVAARLLSWTGFEEDERGFYTVPILSPCHYQFARAIEREVLAHAGVTAEPADKVQNERSIQGKNISEWYVAWCETSGKLKEAKACIGRYQKLVDELQTSGQPRPSVPDHIIHMIQDYGDARADDDRYAASKFGDAITAIRRLLAAPVQAEPDSDDVLGLADTHTKASCENGDRLFDRGGVVQFAVDLVRRYSAPTIPAQVPAAEVRAQALEEAAEVCEMWNTTPGSRLAREIRSLAQQSTADKASEVRAAEWISVEDQLPEPGMWLVAIETDDGMQVHSLELNKKRQWMHEGEPTFCHGYYFDPKFWRPLPAAPSTADSANTGALGEKGADVE